MTTTRHAFVPAVVEPDFDSFAVRQASPAAAREQEPIGKFSRIAHLDPRRR